MTFKHLVGKSTLLSGFTIPKKMHQYISLPNKGEKRIIKLLFGENQESETWLYRINNATGSLQIRYEGKCGEIFKNWLAIVFQNTRNNPNGNCNEYFEVIILDNDTFSIKEYPLILNNALYLEGLITHNINEQSLLCDERFIEIVESIRNVAFKDSGRQAYYNTEIKRELTKRAWLSEQKVVNDKNIRLTCDFRKENMQLEIEFGNARTYYQDIIKFVMSYNVGFIELGGLLVPSTEFAKHLCHLGHLKAIEKSEGKKAIYGGMMEFNKAVVEFQYIKNIFNIPFFIAAINY